MHHGRPKGDDVRQARGLAMLAIQRFQAEFPTVRTIKSTTIEIVPYFRRFPKDVVPPLPLCHRYRELLIPTRDLQIALDYDGVFDFTFML